MSLVFIWSLEENRNKTFESLINTFPKNHLIGKKNKSACTENFKPVNRPVGCMKASLCSISSILLLPVPQFHGYVGFHMQKQAHIHEVSINVCNTQSI